MIGAGRAARDQMTVESESLCDVIALTTEHVDPTRPFRLRTVTRPFKCLPWPLHESSDSASRSGLEARRGVGTRPLDDREHRFCTQSACYTGREQPLLSNLFMYLHRRTMYKSTIWTVVSTREEGGAFDPRDMKILIIITHPCGAFRTTLKPCPDKGALWHPCLSTASKLKCYVDQ